MTNIFKYEHEFRLESGTSLPGFQLAYRTYGSLNQDQSNVIWICHALTGNAEVADWWSCVVGSGKLFDPDKHFIVCANILGSAYGSTGPLSANPATGMSFFHDFPEVTVRDIVKAQVALRKFLNIDSIRVLIGGSLGGQQALEWAIQEDNVVQNLILVATNAVHSPWGIAFNESQRMAIKADRTWENYSSDAGQKGLKAARAIALLSYRNYKTYQATQQPQKEGDKPAVSYQNYQGDKLVARFNAFSYWHLSKAMDSHDVGRGRGGLEKALSTVKAKTLSIAINSDILFPPEESKVTAQGIKNAAYEEIDSLYGHDGFLLEGEKLTEVTTKHFPFLINQQKQHEQII